MLCAQALVLLLLGLQRGRMLLRRSGALLLSVLGRPDIPHALRVLSLRRRGRERARLCAAVLLPRRPARYRGCLGLAAALVRIGRGPPVHPSSAAMPGLTGKHRLRAATGLFGRGPQYRPGFRARYGGGQGGGGYARGGVVRDNRLAAELDERNLHVALGMKGGWCLRARVSVGAW